MKKAIQIVGLLLSAGFGASRADTIEQIMDKQWLQPLADLVELDAFHKLLVLNKQKAYLESVIEKDRQQGLEDPEKIEIMKYLSDKMQFWQNDQKEPVKAVVRWLDSINIHNAYQLLDEGRARNLKRDQETYDEILDTISKSEPEDYLIYHLGSMYAPADDVNGIRTLMSSKAAALALEIQKNAKAQTGSPNLVYGKIYDYIEQLKKKPEDAMKRLNLLPQYRGYSPMEGLRYPMPTMPSTMPQFIADVLEGIKSYGRYLKQELFKAVQPGMERSMRRFAPEDTGRGIAYETERALEESQEMAPMQSNYGIYRMYMQPRMQRLQQEMPAARQRTLEQFAPDEKPGAAKAMKFFGEYQ